MTKANTIKDKFDDGRYELMNGNFEKSIELFSAALKSDPNHKLALLSRGSAFLKLNNVREAIEDFNRALALDPDYAKAYHLRAIAKEKDNRDESALDDLSKAIDIDPEYSAAFYSRATLLTKMKREDEALEDIEMVQHLTNKNIESFANENNIWRSQQLRLESMMESDLGR